MENNLEQMTEEQEFDILRKTLTWFDKGASEEIPKALLAVQYLMDIGSDGINGELDGPASSGLSNIIYGLAKDARKEFAYLDEQIEERDKQIKELKQAVEVATKKRVQKRRAK